MKTKEDELWERVEKEISNEPVLREARDLFFANQNMSIFEMYFAGYEKGLNESHHANMTINAAESRIKELEEKLFIAEACLSGISKMPHMTDCECEPEIGVVCVNCYVCKHIEQSLSKIRG